MAPAAGASVVWKHFTILENQPEAALCNACGKSYTCKGGTTSSLWNHMKASHKEIMAQIDAVKATKKRPADEPASKPAKQVKLTDCIPESAESLNKALDEALVELFADSGIAGLKSFEKVLKVANKRIKLKDPRTYSRMTKLKAKEIKEEILEIIEAVKGDLNCCGFTTDMWTSAAGDPFMSLSLHFIDKDWVLHRFVFI